MKKFYPVNIPNVTTNDIKYVSRVMKNSWISSDGPEVRLFEKKFSKFINKKYSISVANGTAALEIAMKAINIKPDYSDAYYNIGVLFQEVGKNDFAEENYKKAIYLKPNYPEAHNNLGSILQELGSLKEAEISFKKSIKLNPDLLESYINLCDLYEKLNRS